MKKHLFSALLLLMMTLTTPMVQAEKRIIYVPLDNRPVSLDYVARTLQAAGYNLVLPGPSMLSNYNTPGNVDRLWQWLEKTAPRCHAAIVATDSLNYGGLVPSRKHTRSARYYRKYMERLQNLKTLAPELKLYAYSTIMRTPKFTAGNVEPNYYTYFENEIFTLSALCDKEELQPLTAKEKEQKAYLQKYIPQDLMAEWYKRRQTNYSINEQLLAMLGKKQLDFLAIGKDDNAPYSQTHMEARHLLAAAPKLKAKHFQMVPGADQLGMLLLTRAVNELEGRKPLVSVIYAPGGKGGSSIPLYSDQSVQDSVRQQINILGGKPVKDMKKADLVLAVNTPYDNKYRDSAEDENAPYPAPDNRKFANQLNTLVRNHNVALADIAYANGADNGLMYALNKTPVLARLRAYSGWNTADNSIGYALGQGLLSATMQSVDKQKLLETRLLDDWIYQANIRLRLSRDLDSQVNVKLKFDLGKHYHKALELTRKYFYIYREEEPSIRDFSFSYSFPWNRLFEIHIHMD